MASILNYIYILRPYNLIIILLSQYFIQYHVIIPLSSSPTVLDNVMWFLLTITTCIIAASGYIINDIIDKDIDLKNKPKKSYIPYSISVNAAFLYYWTWVGFGFLLACYIALKTNFITHLWIYPLCIALLYFYATRLKSTVLWGNILVSLFVAWVWGILFYIESSTNLSGKILILLGTGFGFLGFGINLMREIVKDIEDMEGDGLAEIRTLPLVYGIHFSKNILYFIGLSILVFIIISSYQLQVAYEGMMFGIFLSCLLALTLFKIYMSNKKSDYSMVSRYLKIILVLGILGIYIFTKNIIYL